MLISFGHLTKKCLLFLGVPIAMLIRILLSSKTEETKLFYQSFLKCLGRAINGILWFVVERTIVSNKKEKQCDKNTKDTKLLASEQNIPQENSDIFNKNELNRRSSIYIQYKSDYSKKKKIERKNNCLILSLLIFVCILDFISMTCQITILKLNYYKDRSGGLVSLTLATRLFAMAILSHFIIKNTKMYSHHYLSIMILIIVVIIINIFSKFTEPESNNQNYFFKLLMMVLPELLFSIMYVFGAKYLYISRGNIYKLLCFEGIIGIILSILLQIVIPFIFSKKYDEILKILKENFDFGSFLNVYTIPTILINICEPCLIWLLIYNFSVNHFGAIYSIQLFSFCLTINGIITMHYIVYVLGSIIVIFMTFVYNEIIILRFYGFDKNTSIEINKRAVLDSNCDFGNEEDEIYAESDDNYIILKGDFDGINDEKTEKL